MVIDARVEIGYVSQDVNRNLFWYCINCLNPKHEYFICFDQLDLGFDPTKQDYTNRLVGLLLACRDLNIAGREHGKRFFVVIFLRQDIYDTLHFEDKNTRPSGNYRRSITRQNIFRAKQPNEGQVREQIPKLRRIQDVGIVEGGEPGHRV
jgi:hypothetical protein